MKNRRYDKLNSLLYLQNQKYHYSHLFNAKKSIDFSYKQGHQHYSLNLKNRYCKQKDKLRKAQNQKLVNKIIQIRENGGNIHQLLNKQIPKQHSLNDNINRKVKNEIQSENIRMKKKLKQIQPSIGTKSEWRTHQNQTKYLYKKLKNKNIYDPTRKLYATLKQFSQNQRDRQKIFTINKHHDASIQISEQKTNKKYKPYILLSNKTNPKIQHRSQRRQSLQ